MIKLKYTPWKPTFADSSDPSPVKELTMTIGDGVSWDEATQEFHNFLRGAGYVIPYNLEWHLDYSDPPDRDKSESLGDRQPEWANSMSGGDDWAEEKLKEKNT